MTLLQRYLLYQLLRVFAANVTVLTVLLVAVGVVRDATENGLSPLQILQILPYIVPSLLPFTIPATLLLTVCLVYGRVAGDQEITAAKAAGINVLSLLWPAFFLGAVLSVCSLLLTDQMIPWAMDNIQQKVILAMEDILLDRLRTNNQETFRDQGISIAVMGVDGKKLVRPTFRYSPDGRKPVTIQAEEATLEFDRDRQHVLLNLRHGRIDVPGQATVEFEQESRPFPLPNESDETKPRHMSVRKIRREIRDMDRQLTETAVMRDVETAFLLAIGSFESLQPAAFQKYEKQSYSSLRRLRRLRTELHSRFALACSCFFFVLVGAPFAVLQARQHFLTSFFLCFMPILMIYYPTVLMMMNLSKSDTVDPAWAMWTANAMLLIASAIILRRVLRY